MTKHDMGQFHLPPVRRDQLHDDITLALDAITAPQPTPSISQMPPDTCAMPCGW